MNNKIVFKEFPNLIDNFSKFETNQNWKLQFVEWDVELDKLDTNDSHNYFRDANLVFEKYSKKSSTLNDAGVINIFYDNIFQYSAALTIIVHGIIYGIL